MCHVTLAAEKLTLRPGGPGAYVPPAPGSHGQPGQAAFLGQPPVGPEVFTPFVPIAADAILTAAGGVLAPLVGAVVLGLAEVALGVAAILALIMATATPAHAPGRPMPVVSPDELRLRTLVAKQTAGTLTQDEEAELIALLAKVKGIHVQRLEDLLTEITIAPEDKIDRSLLDSPAEWGSAPTFKKDGSSVEIHHVGQNRGGPFKEMHKQDHRGKGNDKINHPNKSEPSRIDRAEFAKAKRKYWKKKYPKN